MPAITSLPFVGSAWGRYWLETSMHYSSNLGIAITLPHYSSLDWNGNFIYGPADGASSNVGLHIAGQESVSVYGHGGVAQFHTGVQASNNGNGASGLRIRDTIARLCWFRGFIVWNDGFVLDGCVATKIGGSTDPYYASGRAFGFEYQGAGTARRCVASDIANTGSGTETVGHCVTDNARPIFLEDCVAVEPTPGVYPSIGYWLGGNNSRSVLRGCTAINQKVGFWWNEPTPEQMGALGSYRDCHADGCAEKYIHGPLVIDAGGNT